MGELVAMVLGAVLFGAGLWLGLTLRRAGYRRARGSRARVHLGPRYKEMFGGEKE